MHAVREMLTKTNAKIEYRLTVHCCSHAYTPVEPRDTWTESQLQYCTCGSRLSRNRSGRQQGLLEKKIRCFGGPLPFIIKPIAQPRSASIKTTICRACRLVDLEHAAARIRKNRKFV